MRHRFRIALLAILKQIIKHCVRMYDYLNYSTFMCLSWGADDVTDYHVIAERSYPHMHIFGTKIDRYENNEVSE